VHDVRRLRISHDHVCFQIVELFAAAETHSFPGSVGLSLVAITALTMITMGAQVGLTGRRRLVAVIPFVLAFAVLVTLVVDLNRPQSGLITVGQQSMLDLQSSMSRETK
jgi:hypothetical protein